MRLSSRFILEAVFAALAACVLPVATAAETEVDFTREIRPILAQHCWSCHGPDEASRKAKLRLDLRDVAVAKKAIVPGDPAASEMMLRVHSEDVDEIMPPPEAKKPLTARQKELLRDWIRQGSKYARNWSFTAPERPATPAVKNSKWPKNPIDNFILQRLEQEKLTPSPEADRSTLLRRVSFDLTGIPPTPEELDEFLKDRSADAYEKAVDRLLASPRYGERMALAWLDAARYADTNGYNNDEDRTMWPWRDWVIDAFNSNMPYDRFIVEQLAGDLLPNPTTSQQIATAFNRNLGHNTEGGIIQEEYRVEYVADRVHTTATIFLGLSMQCARCHDHKFDPISQKEYYRFYSFFNNMEEKQANFSGFTAAEPFIKVPSASQETQLKALAAEQKDLEQKISELQKNADAGLARWEQQQSKESLDKLNASGLTLRFKLDEKEGDQIRDEAAANRTGKINGKTIRAEGKFGGALEFDGKTFVDCGQSGAFDEKDSISISAWVRPKSKEATAVLSKIDEAGGFRGYDVLVDGGKVFCHIIHHWPDNALKVSTKKSLTLDTWQHVLLTYDGSRSAKGLKIYVDGKLEPLDIHNDKLKGTIATAKPLHLGRRETSASFKGQLDEIQFFNRTLDAANAAQLAAGQPVTSVTEFLRIKAEDRSAEQRAQLRQFFLDSVDQEYPRLKTALADRARQKSELEKSFPPVMVMKEMPKPRTTHILKRGAYDQPGETVTADVPAFLPPLPPDAPRNRLALAQWLVNPANPLTARVAVNRWWQLIFGAGLVRTVEDFGETGEAPSHPQLLDYLATELVRTGWDVKALHRTIMLSAAYRQVSRTTKKLEERDPENRLLARGVRFRLPAEIVRDNALAVSGLLRERIGGPSVKPYQPAGLWEDVSVERRAKYVADVGDGLYRRSLYTFWKRTCPPPALTTFDAPNREVCVARRARTNTPLQALVLLNDPTYVEAARKFAERVCSTDAKPAQRVERAFRIALARNPTDVERKILLSQFNVALERFRAAPAEASKLLAVGQAVRDEKLDAVELAAWTVACSTLLNLDETISKR